MTDRDPWSRIELIARALVTYQFRMPSPEESPAAFLDALIAHVHRHNYAAAHELRVGRRQADWTPDDVRLFSETVLERRNRPTMEFERGLHAFPIVDDPGPYPVTDAHVRALATRGLETLGEWRQRDPAKHLPIFATALLMTGHTLTTTTGSDNRVAVLKMFARTQPVFGYTLAFDGYVHGIADGKAITSDAIFVHAGTRDGLRLCLIHKYRRARKGRIVFEEVREVDLRATTDHIEDPYAEIFVSVPSPDGRPS
jgi:hypothetical protein